MNDLFKLNMDGTVAIDPYVSFYSIDTAPTGVKVQLLTVGGVATYGVIATPAEMEFYLGWRPVPKGIKNVE